jgi:hypothetical protein
MAYKILNGATATNSPPADTQAGITITSVAGSALVDDEYFTIMREDHVVFTFVWDSNASVTSTDIRRRVTFAGGDSSTTTAAAIATAINAATASGLTATSSGATVTVKRKVPGPQGNGGLNTEAVANGSFAISAAFTSGALAGFPLKGDSKGTTFSDGWRGQDRGQFHVQSIAGSGTMNVTLRSWGRSPYTLKWLPMGSTDATESLRGVLHNGAQIDEDGADNIMHSEPVSGLSGYDRIYMEVVAINGTSTAIDCYLAEVVQ